MEQRLGMYVCIEVFSRVPHRHHAILGMEEAQVESLNICSKTEQKKDHISVQLGLHTTGHF